MKKNYTLLLLAACWVTLAAAQAAEYTPLLCEGKTWHMHHEALFAPEDGIFDFDYFIAGDTIIAGLPCKKLYSHNVYNSGTTDYVLALLEADKKVYCFPAGSVEKHLLYDFGACEGDDILIAGNTDTQPRYVTMHVNENKSINIRGTERQALNVRRLSSEIPIDDDAAWASGWWIAGVGSEEGPLNTWILKLPGNYDNLVSCEVNGTVIYTASDLLLLKEKYMPLLREDVKWVYYETSYDGEKNPARLYTIEIDGDTVINGKTYKKLYRRSDVDWSDDTEAIGCSNHTPAALLREDGRKVYIKKLPARIGLHEFWSNIEKDIDEHGEGVLYDFSNSKSFQFAGFSASNHELETYNFIELGADYGTFVESVGFDSQYFGDLIVPYWDSAISTSIFRSEMGLHHIEDAKGDVIYKGAAFNMTKTGDLNLDRKLDVADVNQLINKILDKSSNTPKVLADIKGDGRVDVEDVNALINAILTPAE